MSIYMKTTSMVYIGYYHKNRNLECKRFISSRLPIRAAEWIECDSVIANDLLKLVKRCRKLRKNGQPFGRKIEEYRAMDLERDRLRQAFAHLPDPDKKYSILVAIEDYKKFAPMDR